MKAATTTLRLVSVDGGPIAQASAALTVRTPGASFTDITREIVHWLIAAKAGDGVLSVFIRHTSASLTIQENADPDVLTDLVTALDRLAPRNAGYVHDTEGADDMPAHIKTLISGVSLSVPVAGGRMRLGTWQGIYVAEHRARPHEREVILTFQGTLTG